MSSVSTAEAAKGSAAMDVTVYHKMEPMLRRGWGRDAHYTVVGPTHITHIILILGGKKKKKK